MKNIIFMIALIFQGFMLTVNCQTLKTFKGPFKESGDFGSGELTYTYYENSNMERVYHGVLTYNYTTTSKQSLYSESKFKSTYKCTFKDNIKDGPFSLVWIDQKLSQKIAGSFKDGVLDGEVKIYGRSDGVLVSDNDYGSGMVFENGSLIAYKEVVNGKLVTKTIKNGYLEGVWDVAFRNDGGGGTFTFNNGIPVKHFSNNKTTGEVYSNINLQYVNKLIESAKMPNNESKWIINYNNPKSFRCSGLNSIYSDNRKDNGICDAKESLKDFLEVIFNLNEYGVPNCFEYKGLKKAKMYSLTNKHGNFSGIINETSSQQSAKVILNITFPYLYPNFNSTNEEIVAQKKNLMNKLNKIGNFAAGLYWHNQCHYDTSLIQNSNSRPNIKLFDKNAQQINTEFWYKDYALENPDRCKPQITPYRYRTFEFKNEKFFFGTVDVVGGYWGSYQFSELKEVQNYGEYLYLPYNKDGDSALFKMELNYCNEKCNEWVFNDRPYKLEKYLEVNKNCPGCVDKSENKLGKISFYKIDFTTEGSVIVKDIPTYEFYACNSEQEDLENDKMEIKKKEEKNLRIKKEEQEKEEMANKKAIEDSVDREKRIAHQKEVEKWKPLLEKRESEYLKLKNLVNPQFPGDEVWIWTDRFRPIWHEYLNDLANNNSMSEEEFYKKLEEATLFITKVNSFPKRLDYKIQIQKLKITKDKIKLLKTLGIDKD